MYTVGETWGTDGNRVTRVSSGITVWVMSGILCGHRDRSWPSLTARARHSSQVLTPRRTCSSSKGVHTANSSATPAPAKVWTAVALHCGHDRRGKNTKTTGEPYPDDFPEIGTGFVIVTRNAVLAGSDHHKSIDLVPRYYDTSALSGYAQAERLGAKLVSLGETARLGYVLIRKGHEVGAEAYRTGDVPFIRTSDISIYEISIDPTRSVSEDIYRQYADQQKLAAGDILLVSDGRYRIGRTAILHDHNYRCVVQSHIRIITVNEVRPLAQSGWFIC